MASSSLFLLYLTSLPELLHYFVIEGMSTGGVTEERVSCTCNHIQNFTRMEVPLTHQSALRKLGMAHLGNTVTIRNTVFRSHCGERGKKGWRYIVFTE